MKTIYHQSYGNIEVINIVYENKQAYFYEGQDKKSIFPIEKRDIDKGSKDYGYYLTLGEAELQAKSYLANGIKEFTKKLESFGQ